MNWFRVIRSLDPSIVLYRSSGPHDMHSILFDYEGLRASTCLELEEPVTQDLRLVRL